MRLESEENSKSSNNNGESQHWLSNRSMVEARGGGVSSVVLICGLGGPPGSGGSKGGREFLATKYTILANGATSMTYDPADLVKSSPEHEE